MAARDLFDPDILIRMEAVPPAEMIRDLRTPQVRERLYQKLEAITWDLFEAQVLPYLPEDTARRISREDFEEMRVRVGLAVAKWLEDDEPAQGGEEHGPRGVR